MGLSITPFLTLFFVVTIYHLLLLILNCFFPIFFYLHQIANVFGPAFLLKLYVGGALTGSVFFLLEKDFLAHQKQVRTHGVSKFYTSGFQILVRLSSAYAWNLFFVVALC
jgi:hypothetical protein